MVDPVKKEIALGKKILIRLLRVPSNKRLYSRCKRHYDSVNDPAHDWAHISFVLELSLALGSHEKADLNVLFVSALLHDIARCDEVSGKCSSHEKHGARKALKFIKVLELTSLQKKNIIHSIREHSSSTGSPKSIEAKIIADCDRLYAIVTNPQRCIAFSKMNGGIMSDACTYLNKKLERMDVSKFHTKRILPIVKVEYSLLKKRVAKFESYWKRA